MAGDKDKYKKALERYAVHLQEIKSVTSTIPKGTDAEREARIKRAREDYAYFVQTYFPHLATSKCGKFQIDAANYIKGNERARCVFEWARGHAKSSHISLMIPLWLKIQENHEPIIMVLVSKSADSARRLLADLQAELEGNDLFINDFGKQQANGLWTDGEFICADGSMFIALGRGQSPRGIKRRGLRVNYISIDDIDDDEMCRNPRRVGEGVDWCLSALIGAMAMGRGRFVLVGNRIGRSSILGEIAERPHFYHTVVNALDKKGQPTWIQNYTLKEINDLRIEMGERRFQKEYMNNPLNEGAVFERKYIQFGKMLPLRQYRQIITYTDPSFKSSTTNDFKATLLVGVTKEGSYHVLKAFADQTKVSDMVEWHYTISDYVGDTPNRYYMESNFIQDLLMDEFKKVGAAVGRQIPITGDGRKKPDKFARIEALQPLFQRGEIILNEAEQQTNGMKILEDQLLLFQKGSKAHDDAPDALEGAIWMLSNKVRTSQARYVVGARPNRKY